MGGTSNGVDSLDLISEYKNDTWNQIGTLRHPRMQHSAIFNAREIMIVGGKGKPERPTLEVYTIASSYS